MPTNLFARLVGGGVILVPVKGHNLPHLNGPHAGSHVGTLPIKKFQEIREDRKSALRKRCASVVLRTNETAVGIGVAPVIVIRQ